MRLFIFLLLFIVSSPISFSQSNPTSNKGKFYFYWGYNRSYYSRSDIHFEGPDYDFTLYSLKANDRPSKFGKVYFNPATISVPQYNTRIGYFFKEHLSVSFGVDHMKYVVENGQETRISGIITPEASQIYQGTYLNETIILDKDILEFEHTDGFNLVTLEVEYLRTLFHLDQRKHFRIEFNTGLGGIWIATKTNVRVFGDGLDNDFHIAGYAMVAKAGPRINFKDKLFLMCEVKGGYASLPSVFIKNASPESADHNLLFLEYYIALGTEFRLFGRKNKS